MKLFYFPGSCALSPHIVLNELGIKHEVEKVDYATKKTKSGDFNKINPKGYVPTLQLDNGEVLTEGTAIVQYLADQKPEAKLIPKAGTWERYKAIEWLNFIATEVHKPMGAMFGAAKMLQDKKGQEELKAAMLAGLSKRFDYLTEHLKKNTFLMGKDFTVADAYLFTVLGWTKHLNIDLSKWPALMGYWEKIQMRPAVAKALAEEGAKH